MGTNLRQTSEGGLQYIDDVTSSKVFEIGGINFRNMKIRKVALTGVPAITGGALFSWQNPENVAVIIDRIEVDIAVKSTGAANGSFGTAADGVTSSANLIDTYALGGTAAVINNIDNKGTNGKSVQKVPVGGFVNGTGSADTTGLSGYVYIHYYLV